MARDQVIAESRGRDPREDRAGPAAVVRKGRVRVGGVAELSGGLGHRRTEPVLRTVRCGHVRVKRSERGEEALLLPLEQHLVVVEVEHRRHEVVVARTLLEAPDQVGDRDVELTRVHDRRVEQEAADVLLDDLGLPLGHAQEHLDLHAVAHLALPGEQPRVREVEQVVPGDADSDVVDVLRLQGEVDDALVVGVGLLLGAPRRERPVVERRLDPLHRQVGALDDADLDPGAALGAPFGGPRLQAHHGAEGVRQVGLKDDAGLEAEQLGLVEDRGEDRHREVEIAVLLHVEVDELRLWGARRLLEQRRQALHDVLDGLVEGPRGMRSDGGRDLDRHVVHVGTGQQRMRALEPASGLLVAKHGLAQQVDVEPRPASPDLRDGLAQTRVGGIDDQVPDHGAQRASYERDHQVGQDTSGRPSEAYGGAQVPGQERRHVPGEGGEVAGGDPRILRPDHPVDESNREGQAVRILQDAGELGARAVGRHLRGAGEPAAYESDGLVGELERVRCAVGDLSHAENLGM